MFMIKFLTLVPDHKRKMVSDLVIENFLKDYEKVPGYKASFEFKTKMFTSIRSQRMSLVPLFKLVEMVTKVKLEVDDTLDISRAAFIPEDDAEASYSGWEVEDL